jgi:hypothetical protein
MQSAPELQQLPPQMAEMLCGVYERCFGALFDVFLLEDCAELAERRLVQGGFSRIQSAVETGSVDYDPSQVEGCRGAYEALECGELLNRNLEACQGVFKGTLQAGEECEIDEECVGDSVCLALDSCPGVCAPRQTAGEPCTSDDQCADGLVCSVVTELCVAPRAEGETCEGGVEAQCTPGLLCLGADEETGRVGTCRTVDGLFVALEGGDCDILQGPLCQVGLSCVLVQLSVTGNSIAGTCAAAVGSGEDCALAVPSQCPEGEYCAINAADLLTGDPGACTPLPLVGEACAPDFGGPRCEAFARCVDDTCVAMRNLGETCTSDEICYSERCVDGGCAPSGGC